jgi:signal transduction histidine kinase
VTEGASVPRRRVVIVDDHAAFADLRRLALEGLDDLECVGTAGTAAVTVTARLGCPLAEQVAAFLYRCVRECAINVAKHPSARTVLITLDSDATGIRLAVADDGVGVAPDAVGRDEGHLGLTLLREAAVDLDGELRVEGGPGGTLVTIELPP